MRQVSINVDGDNVTYPNGKFIGYVGEHYETQLLIRLDVQYFEGMDYNILAFSDGKNKYYSSVATENNGNVNCYRTGGLICCKLWQQLTQSNILYVTVEAYVKDENENAVLVKKTPLIGPLYLEYSAQGIPDKTYLNTIGAGGDLSEVLHTHENKEVLDKFTESDGALAFDGTPVASEWDTLSGKPPIEKGNLTHTLIGNDLENNGASGAYAATFGYDNTNDAGYGLVCGYRGHGESDDLLCVGNGDEHGGDRSAAFRVKRGVIRASVPIEGVTPQERDSSKRLPTTEWIHTLLRDYALTDHRHDNYYYGKIETDNKLNLKAGIDHYHDSRYYKQDVLDTMLAGKLNSNDVINNLTSNDANKPLSAAQGKALKAQIDSIPTPSTLENYYTNSETQTKISEAAQTISADIPTKVSDLTNDSGFITSASVPTKVSDLTNDSGFITASDVPTDISELTNSAGYITSAALSDYYTKTQTNTLLCAKKNVPAVVTTGANASLTLADNTEYRLTGVAWLNLTYPSGSFESFLRLTFVPSGAISVSFPAGTQYIGNVPSFSTSETWEISIKDGVAVCGKVES